MKSLLCFDLDNTLVYSEKVHVNSYNYALKKALSKTRKPSYMVKLFGRPHNQIVSMLARNVGNKKIKEIMKIHDDVLIKKFSHLAKPISNVHETLKELKKKYVLAVLSNCAHANIIAILKGAKIPRGLFSAIIGYDNVKHSKPYPDMILKAEKILLKRCLFMIGDSPYDILAANKVGARGIAVLTGHYSLPALKKANPYIILKSVNQLPEFLAGIAP